MRICHKTIFPVKIDIKLDDDLSNGCDFTIYDSTFNIIESFSNTTRLEFDIALPNRLMIQVNSNRAPFRAELSRFNLAGINVERDKLLTAIEYRTRQSDTQITSIDELNKLPSEKSLTCTRNGYVIVNLFHPNPFAWHLYLGNKIKF